MKALKTILTALTLYNLLLSPAVLFAQDGDPLKQGISDYKEENYEEAIENLKKARSLDQKSFEAAYYLGLSLKATEEFMEAKRHLTEAVSLRTGADEARLSLAETLYILGEYDGALKEVETLKGGDYRGGEVLFLEGQILLKKESYPGAVEAFRRAKEKEPGMAQASDYHAGLAYLKEKRLGEAMALFDEAAVKDPATDLALYAEGLSRAIEKREERERALSVTAGLRYEYDDNVILKPADSPAAAGISGEIDRREVLTLRAQWRHRANGAATFRAAYSLYFANQNRLNGYDMHSHTIHAVPGYSMKDSAINLPLSYSHTLVDNSGYLAAFGASPTYLRQLGPAALFSANLKLQVKDFLKRPFSSAEDRDSVEAGGGASYTVFFGRGEGFWSIRYELNREDADGENWDYTGNKASVNALHPFTSGWKAQAYVEGFLKDFRNTNTYFGKRRKDRTYTVSALLSREVYRRLDVVMQYTRIRDDSNVAAYDYNRNIVSAGAEYRF